MVSSFNREPEYKHGTAARTAILLVNLGTPDAPTKEALRRYLKQFLSDRRVVELSDLVWKPVLNGVILNTRPAQSAAKYAKIWEKEGSPLKIHTAKQANLLTGYLGKAGAKVHVDYAMRYGSPSIPDVLSKLKAEGYQRILVIPLYPQYAASTTATVVDEVGRWLQKTRNQPEIRFLRSFCDHSAYIDALAISVRHHWFQEPPPARDYCLVMSFHGMPRAAFEAGDPYHCECQKTARLLASKLNIGEDWQLTFQSRFGRAKWLEPYTAPTLQSLARQGIKRVDILCPGFVSDCLETLEEIAIEAKSVFLKAGGQEFNYIPCLNEDDAWIRCLVSLSEIHLAGWPVLEGTSAAELTQSAALAKALGAKI